MVNARNSLHCCYFLKTSWVTFKEMFKEKPFVVLGVFFISFPFAEYTLHYHPEILGYTKYQSWLFQLPLNTFGKQRQMLLCYRGPPLLFPTCQSNTKESTPRITRVA